MVSCPCVLLLLPAVVFAVGDYLGRVLSGYGPWGRGAPKPLSILTYSLLRCVRACVCA
jgi:equilibrative nucleoside transporter 1/2/3